ncbi:flagellar hook-length control protein FliK [Ruegeria lacuscaerulensis]|uniref:flagellar hook-length control protein FliK n=1 Tax=Ruegeria lacuscaerulensis TaxID=55218 RepID=UPI00147A84E8|nr:flagellar hook-length control protein FliK [Ruegeria lacuscaerulensis]
MPNPLSAVMPPPAAAAKPDANTQKQRDPKGATSFQTVMDQEADQHSEELETAELKIQKPDPDSEMDEIIAEVDPAEISVAPEVQQPADAKSFAPESVPIPPVEDHEAKPTLLPSVGIADEEPELYAPPVAPGRISVRSPENSGERLVPPVDQALATDSVSALRTTETALKSQHTFKVPAVLHSRPRETADLSSSFGQDQNAPRTPTAPELAPKQPTLPDRAPALVQIQLLATERSSDRIESSAMPETEDALPVRDAPLLSAARETGTTLQPLTAARAETAKAIAGQMATAVSARPQSGAIEIALNPEELGRVSIVLNGRDDGLHMTIAAERPETLDMMRRHLSLLETEFQNLGLGDLSFDLDTSSDAQQDGSNADDRSPFSAPEPEHTAKAGPALPRIGPDGRIDMRL